ncbi:cache domain-containing protein [Roseofilum sp. BLCC_M154]|uniref:Cache domain-containing protein n=1 Tax=Roseofilum acuticapitatum BLCC-M154 TaxID=3022444 RepID=A0ABT7AQV7_9CYAN|nr:cache domain-containing protein [Roseofilum acuticapitatum]MDJ1169292.1 cache domain-containing protein [Roseofilum acuticapitatum BLCC-M154]
MVSLKKIIPILTVTPLMATLTFTWILANYNERKTVDELSQYWIRESVNQIESNIHMNLRQPEIIYELSLNHYRSNPSIYNNPQNLTLILYNKVRLFTSINNIYFGDVNGDFIGVKLNDSGQITQSYAGKETNHELTSYTLNREGKRGQIISKNPVFHATHQPWYQKAEKANNLVWSPVYPDFTTRQLAITAAQAVRDRQGNLVGVFGVDYFLNTLHEFLRDVSISKAAKVLIIQDNGQLIASSDPDPLTILDPESETHWMIAESPDPIIQEVGNRLINQFSDTSLIQEAKQFVFWHDNHKYFTWVEPIENDWDLHWIAIIILSESDVFNSADKNSILFFLFLTAIIGSIFAGWSMHQLVVSPLLQLNKTARQIKSQKFNPNKIAGLVKRNDEIGHFSRVFEEMVLLIQEQQSNLEKRIENLSTYKTKITDSEEEHKSPEITLSYWDYLKEKSRQIRQSNTIKKND